MEPEGSLPQSQVLATCPCPEPARSSPYPHVQKNPVSNWWFSCASLKKIIIPYALTVPSLSHLTSCTPNKFNLYLANSLAAAVTEPALYRLLTFHVPNGMSLFFDCVGCTDIRPLVSVLSFVSCRRLVVPFFNFKSQGTVKLKRDVQQVTFPSHEN